MLVWREEKGKLVTESGRLRAVLEKTEGGWAGSIYDGEARLSATYGKSDEAVVSTVTRRLARALLVEPGECTSCGGATYPFRNGAKRCLTRGCDLFKKKGA
jgi:predicted Zn-ribbon and HTH transcriptional regulator